MAIAKVIAIFYGSVAQMEEHSTTDAEVVGSNPAILTKMTKRHNIGCWESSSQWYALRITLTSLSL